MADEHGDPSWKHILDSRQDWLAKELDKKVSAELFAQLLNTKENEHLRFEANLRDEREARKDADRVLEGKVDAVDDKVSALTEKQYDRLTNRLGALLVGLAAAGAGAVATYLMGRIG